jgi:hypothetical protein
MPGLRIAAGAVCQVGEVIAGNHDRVIRTVSGPAALTLLSEGCCGAEHHGLATIVARNG